MTRAEQAPVRLVRLCRACRTRPVHGFGKEAQARFCLECQLAGLAELPPRDRSDDGATCYVHLCLVEFVCLSCGRFVCNVRAPRESAPIQLPRSVRCETCRGVPVRSGETSRVAMPVEASA